MHNRLCSPKTDFPLKLKLYPLKSQFPSINVKKTTINTPLRQSASASTLLNPFTSPHLTSTCFFLLVKGHFSNKQGRHRRHRLLQNLYSISTCRQNLRLLNFRTASSPFSPPPPFSFLHFYSLLCLHRFTEEFINGGRPTCVAAINC